MKVYVGGNPSDPPILLLHELPGLLPETTCFADRLVHRGYRVYMPLFFGDFGHPVGTIRQMGVCMGPNFNCLSTKESAIIGRLSILRDRISAEHPGQPLGVIGMCLTGGMPLALAGKNVAAVVLSQPAIPFPFTASQRSAIGASNESIAAAVKAHVHVLRLRFENDCLVPKERFDAIEHAIPAEYLETEVVPTNDKRAHSVLTIEAENPATHDAIEHALRFLDTYVGGKP